MKSKNELKEIDIKTSVCYYFDDLINGAKINFSNILLDKNHNISYETIDKIDGFIISLVSKIKHLILIDYGLLNNICGKIKYLTSKKSCNTNSINHNFGKIRTDSQNSLPIKKILTFHNVITLIKSFLDKTKNKYYHDMFLEKGSYKDK